MQPLLLAADQATYRSASGYHVKGHAAKPTPLQSIFVPVLRDKHFFHAFGPLKRGTGSGLETTFIIWEHPAICILPGE